MQPVLPFLLRGFLIELVKIEKLYQFKVVSLSRSDYMISVVWEDFALAVECKLL